MKEMKWFEMWMEDKRSMIDTMIDNVLADLEAGYKHDSSSITKQMDGIKEYKKEMDDQIDKFKEMEDARVERWCYYDMKKRGVI